MSLYGDSIFLFLYSYDAKWFNWYPLTPHDISLVAEINEEKRNLKVDVHSFCFSEIKNKKQGKKVNFSSFLNSRQR